METERPRHLVPMSRDRVPRRMWRKTPWREVILRAMRTKKAIPVNPGALDRTLRAVQCAVRRYADLHPELAPGHRIRLSTGDDGTGRRIVFVWAEAD